MTEAQERDKYRRMWEHDAYRVHSPAMAAKKRILDLFWADQMQGSGYDYGCGENHLAAYLTGAGYEFTGIDFCPSAVVNDDAPFIEACLWDLPNGLEVREYGTCVDVLEHIPPEHVEDVLAGIAEFSPRLAYLQIATFADACGKRIGETLHLTVQPAEWWVETLAPFFKVVTPLETKSSGYACFAVEA